MASARKIIIIGATSGIGYEITQLYRKQGWRIGIAGRRTELLAKIESGLAKIKKNGKFAEIYRKWFGKNPPQALLEE